MSKMVGFQKHIAGLRATAILLVILSHFGVPGFSGGFIGVDVFFVISGFLITGILTREYQQSIDPSTGRGRISLGNFYRRRAKRILPASIVVLVVTLTWVFFNLNHFRFIAVFKDFLWSLFFAANINFSLQDSDYFQTETLSPLLHFWSLAVEEQFYFVWPAILILALSWQGRHWQKRVLWLLVWVTAASLLCMVLLFIYQPVSAYYLLPSRAWELGVGAIAGLLVNHFGLHERIPRMPAWLLNLAGVALVASMFLVTSTNFGFTMIVPVLLTTILIVFAGDGSGRSVVAGILGWAPMQFIGKISYSLYLWHWPVWILAGQVGYLKTAWGVAIAIAVIFVCSTMSFYIVEQPFLRAKPQVAFGTWIGVAVLALSAVFPLGGAVSLPTDSNGSLLPTAKPSGSVSLISLQAERKKLLAADLVVAASGKVSLAQRAAITRAITVVEWRNDYSGWACRKTEIDGADCFIGTKQATKHWLAIGDSMTAQYRGALRKIVELNPSISVRLIYTERCPNALGKSGMRAASMDPGFLENNANCQAAHDRLFQNLGNSHFDLALFSDSSRTSDENYLPEATKFALKVHRNADSLLFLGANPEVPELAQCLNRDFSNLSACNGEPGDDHNISQVALAVDAPLLPVTDVFCLKRVCPAVIGDWPLFSDGHLSADQVYHSGQLIGELIRASVPAAF